jgi:hypothetical protein
VQQLCFGLVHHINVRSRHQGKLHSDHRTTPPLGQRRTDLKDPCTTQRKTSSFRKGAYGIRVPRPGKRATLERMLSKQMYC